MKKGDNCTSQNPTNNEDQEFCQIIQSRKGNNPGIYTDSCSQVIKNLLPGASFISPWGTIERNPIFPKYLSG